MADNEGQGPNETGQGPTQQTEGSQSQGSEGQGPTGGGRTPSVDDLLAEVRSLRNEAAKYRTERNSLSEKVKSYEQERMSEQEKMAQRLRELEEQNGKLTQHLRTTEDRQTISSVATKLGFHDPHLAYRLLDLEEIRGEDGKIDAEPALRELLKSHPYLAGTGGADGGAGGRPPRSKDMNSLIRGTARRSR